MSPCRCPDCKAEVQDTASWKWCPYCGSHLEGKVEDVLEMKVGPHVINIIISPGVTYPFFVPCSPPYTYPPYEVTCGPIQEALTAGG